MSQALMKFSGADLASLAPRLTLPPAAAAAVQGIASVGDALERLEAGGFLLEATRLVAHALPKREAVWWACMCAAHPAPADPPDAARRAPEPGGGQRFRQSGSLDGGRCVLEW